LGNTFGASENAACASTGDENRTPRVQTQKRLLIVGSEDPAAEAETACRQIGIDPVLLRKSEIDVLSPESLLAAAKEARPDGVWAAEPFGWAETRSVAEQLGCACPPKVTLDEDKSMGVRVASDVDAQTVAQAIGAPVWVRAEGGTGTDWCLRVADATDVTIDFRKAITKSVTGLVTIQRVAEGESYRVVGFKWGRGFKVAAILSECYGGAPYRVLHACTAPVPVCGNLCADIAHAAQEVCAGLQKGAGLIEVEVVLGEEGARVVNVCATRRVDPVRRSVIKLALGIDVLQEALRVAVGEAPRLSPTRGVGAPARWLTARSGNVATVSGKDAAREQPGIETVVVNAKVSDTIQHLEDRASRDRLGYVVATGATSGAALLAAENACAAITIDAQTAMD
jgi:biotin carboxylase